MVDLVLGHLLYTPHVNVMRPAPPRQVKGVIANFFLREMIWASYSAIRPLGHPALADRSARL